MGPKKEESSIKAYMGEDTVFKGTLSFEGTVRIDGKFEGQVKTKDTLIIGETGDVAAEIIAGTVICKGRIRGTIVASQRVEMHASSKVVGNVQTPALNIELGAILDGNCNMSGKEGKIIKLVKGGASEADSAKI
ncbi:MAG: polymer-forming cytoskeletal protein [Nitrospinae bacterium]|nr:polymer-forming cytoskeletal protein [Nitrospinota bacterium]